MNIGLFGNFGRDFILKNNSLYFLKYSLAIYLYNLSEVCRVVFG